MGADSIVHDVDSDVVVAGTANSSSDLVTVDLQFLHPILVVVVDTAFERLFGTERLDVFAGRVVHILCMPTVVPTENLTLHCH